MLQKWWPLGLQISKHRKRSSWSDQWKANTTSKWTCSTEFCWEDYRIGWSLEPCKWFSDDWNDQFYPSSPTQSRFLAQSWPALVHWRPDSVINHHSTRHQGRSDSDFSLRAQFGLGQSAWSLSKTKIMIHQPKLHGHFWSQLPLPWKHQNQIIKVNTWGFISRSSWSELIVLLRINQQLPKPIRQTMPRLRLAQRIYHCGLAIS